MPNKITLVSRIITRDNLDFVDENNLFQPCHLNPQDLFGELFPGINLQYQNSFVEFHRQNQNQQYAVPFLNELEEIKAFAKASIADYFRNPRTGITVEPEFVIDKYYLDNFREDEDLWFEVQGDQLRYISKNNFDLRQKKMKICLLKYKQGMSENEIIKEIGYSLQHVGRILKQFIQSPETFAKSVETNQLIRIPVNELLSTIDKILKAQTVLLSADKIKNMIEIHFGFSLYKNFQIRRFLKSHGYKFKKVKKSVHYSPRNYSAVKTFLKSAVGLMKTNEILYSFDVSTIVSDNLQKKSWAKKNENFRIPVNFVYDYCHLLAIIDQQSIIGFQFVKGKVTARTINCFFIKTLKQIRDRVPIQKTIYIIIDNAAVNRSMFMNLVCSSLNVKLLFIVPLHPFLNPIERF